MSTGRELKLLDTVGIPGVRKVNEDVIPLSNERISLDSTFNLAFHLYKRNSTRINCADQKYIPRIVNNLPPLAKLTNGLIS